MFFKLFTPLAFFCAIIVFFTSAEASIGVGKGDIDFSMLDRNSERLLVDPKQHAEDAFSFFTKCVEHLSTKAAGEKLVDLVNQLLKIYFSFEKRGMLHITRGEYSFTGFNSGTPEIKNSGDKKIFIKPKPIFFSPTTKKEQNVKRLLSEVLILEESKKENDYYPLELRERNSLKIEEGEEWIFDIYESAELFFKYGDVTPFFDVEIREESVKKSPTLALALDVPKDFKLEDFKPDAIDDRDPQKSPFFVLVAHELIHMKHFLEEKIFLHQVASKLAQLCVSQSPGVIEVVNALCGAQINPSAPEKEIQQSILSSVKSFKKFKELSGLAIKRKINTTCPMQFMDQSLSYVGDLKYFPYSASKERDAEATQFFEYVKQKYLNVSGSDDSSFDIKSFGDLEELRTVSGPDRDGITENVIRREFGLLERQKY